METKSTPLPTPENQATGRLLAAVESGIGGVKERVAGIANANPDAKWSVSDLIRLLELRDQLQGQRPRTIHVCWVADPADMPNHRN